MAATNNGPAVCIHGNSMKRSCKACEALVEARKPKSA